MIRIVVGVLLGGLLGSIVGYAVRCAGGQCPLTCNPVGAMLIGALIGLLLARPAQEPKEPFKRSPNVITIETPAAFAEVISNTDVVLVDFYADWCGPCRMLKPTIHELADLYVGKMAVVEVNVDKVGDLAGKYGVSSIPDVKIFKKGEVVRTFVGVRGRSDYESAVLDALGQK